MYLFSTLWGLLVQKHFSPTQVLFLANKLKSKKVEATKSTELGKGLAPPAPSTTVPS